MLTGVESAIAENAVTAAIRAATLAKREAQRFIDRRALQLELASGPAAQEIASFVDGLEPSQAEELQRFLSSPEMANIATNMAIENLYGKCGSRSNHFGKHLKAQIKQLISLNTNLRDSNVDQGAELAFAATSLMVDEYVSSIISANKSLSRTAKASILKTQDVYIRSVARNSELLARIGDLAEFQGFQNDVNIQVGNLHGTMRIPHVGATRRVPYDKLYVQPHVQFDEGRASEEVAISPHSLLSIQDFTAEHLINQVGRVILLGDPGGGKSTLSLKLATDCASGHGIAKTTIPFLVILREYAAELAKKTIPLIDYLDQICRIPLALVPPNGAIEYFLLNGRALVIFDGLDELLDTALRRQVVEAVEGFALRYPTARILVTSRRVGYPDAPLNPELFSSVHLGEFSAAQVSDYVQKWFNLDESESPTRRAEFARSFMNDSLLVRDLRVNPLMLSLMCGIYASEHYIPRNRPDVYEKCALLLFETWDKQRGIKPALSFDAHVQAAMRSLALWLYPQQLSKQGLPRSVLISHMTDYLLKKRFDNDEEAENAATEFVDFCKGRAWVLTDVGAELYGFTHRTFLEYFTASQIVRENTNARKLIGFFLDRILSGGWEVVAQLSLQILNKSVEDGADDFLRLLIDYVLSHKALSNSKLMAFAAQSLTYIVPRPDVLRSIVHGTIDELCALGSGNHKQEDVEAARANLAYLFGASAENLVLISRYTFDVLEARLTAKPSDKVALAMALHPDRYCRNAGRAVEYEISNDNEEFWRGEAEVVRGRFSSIALDVAQRDSEIAVELCEYGLISIGEVFERFGPGPFFYIDTDDSLYVQQLPLAHRLVLMQQQAGLLLRVMPDLLQSKELVCDLHRLLLGLETPWLRSEEVGSGSSFFRFELAGHILNEVMASPSDRAETIGSLPAVVLLAASLIDLTSFNDRAFLRPIPHDLDRTPLERTTLGGIIAVMLRIRVMLRHEIDAEVSELEGLRASVIEVLKRFDADERTVALLSSWLTDRKFEFIRGPRFGRRRRR